MAEYVKHNCNVFIPEKGISDSFALEPVQTNITFEKAAQLSHWNP